MGQGGAGDLFTADHSCNLGDPAFHVCQGVMAVAVLPLLYVFFDSKMAGAKPCNLGKVGDADHLVGVGKRPELFADLVRGSASHAGIHLVKYKGAKGLCPERMALRARTTLESSPPEAMRLRALLFTGLGEMRNDTRSMPLGEISRSSTEK